MLYVQFHFTLLKYIMTTTFLDLESINLKNVSKNYPCKLRFFYFHFKLKLNYKTTDQYMGICINIF